MVLVGVSVSLIDQGSTTSGKWILVTALFVYLLFYALGVGATPNIVNSEIFPIHLRGIGNSMGTVGTWLSNYVISAIFLTTTETTLGEVFIIF